MNELETRYQSIVFIGKITSGKGTQAKNVADVLDCDVFSTGDKVREATTFDSVFGKKMKEVYEEGSLIPEWIAEYWMMHGLFVKYSNHRLIFEGVAKKPDEAKLFHEIHEWLDRPYIVFNLEVPDDVVCERTEKRKRDAVDAEEVMKKRLQEYSIHTTKSLEVFREAGTLIDIDGTLSIEEVTKEVFAKLAK